MKTNGLLKHRRKTLAATSMVIFLTLVAILGLVQTRPPNAVGLDAPASEFSSGRAMEDLQHVASRAHPTGSPENHEVRDYIYQVLASLEVEPQRQTTEVLRQYDPRYVRVCRVGNIIVRLPGTNPTKSVLLMGHYDTVPNAPGATDDGSGVVTLLETLRAIKASPPLRNDVIFLFTDAEEIGLMGARAFVEQHPLAADVGVALNFEGSGSGGPTLMFEASNQNGWLIRQMAASVELIVANSLSYEVYKRMPNDTDLSPFKQAGHSGLNFAYIEKRYDYHTAGDNLQNIDERSIQHHGAYALNLTRHLGDLNLNDTKGADRVYFNSMGFGFVHYPVSWALPISLLALACFIAVSFLGIRSGLVKLPGALYGCFAFLTLCVFLPALVACVFRLISNRLQGIDRWLLTYDHNTLLVAFASLAVGIGILYYGLLIRGWKWWYSLFAAVVVLGGLAIVDLLHWALIVIAIVAFPLLYLLFRNGRCVWELSVGALLGWAVLQTIIAIMVPGASFAAVWPFMFSLIPLAVIFVKKANEASSFGVLILLAVCAVPAVLWYTELTYLISLSMGFDMISGTVLIVTLLLGLLIPHIDVMTARARTIVPIAAVVVSVVLSSSVLLGFDFNERYQKPNTLFYATDADADDSFWGSTDGSPDEWTSHYLTESPDTTDMSRLFATSNESVWRYDAPNANLAAPEIVLVAEAVGDSTRMLTLRVTSPREAAVMSVSFPPDNPVVAAAINEIQIEGLDRYRSSSSWWLWRYYGIPEDGFLLELTVRGADPVEIKLTDLSYGLPEIDGFQYEPRLNYMMPNPYSLSDQTLVTKSFTFQ